MFITRIYYAIAYFVVLIFEIIKAEIDVAFRTINGDVKPVIMEIETVLARPISQTILANSITLTPGTLSIDLDSEKKILKVATIVKRDKKAVIPFEHYIKGMLE
ncbi:MAG: Na+/H+ antiporter subunit E [Methanobacteriaceae archaeon]|nr:Na+/H+ antiporter subunit E [Methanobacteriaceae archaeon]